MNIIYKLRSGRQGIYWLELVQHTVHNTLLPQLDNHDVPRDMDYTIIELVVPVTRVANF